MTKKCLVCGADAEYQIKDTSDYYCPACAEENFGDIALLVKVEEEEAKKLKSAIQEKLDDDTSND